jgi:hypothetical protein
MAPAFLRRDFSWGWQQTERRWFRLEDGSHLAADCSWQPNRTACPTLIALHGLEGSSESGYMLGVSHKAYHYRFNAIRLNLRNCGDTAHRSETLYHSGQSGDLQSIITALREEDGLDRIGVVGFSLGGNIGLKLAGEWGANAPDGVLGVAAVSPLADLTVSWQPIERWENTIYRWMFVRNLKQTMRRRARLFPGRYDLSRLRGLRTIRDFDERYQAPYSGFRDADDYYQKASAFPLLPNICLPTLIIHAEDDPILPAAPFQRPEVRSNPNIITLLTKHGGHVAFIARSRDGDLDRYWAENRVVEFFHQLLGVY